MNEENKIYTKKGISMRNKILVTAEKLFAEKGYEGSSVGEIAMGVGIDKSTLYHYFKSKENILKDIIDAETLKYRKERAKKFEMKKLFNNDGSINEDSIEIIVENGILFTKKYENFFRIILTESLKTNKEDIIGFEIFNTNLMNLLNELESFNIKIKNKKEIISKLFFFEIIPLINFVTMNDSFSQFYEINPEELRSYFKKTYKRLYKEIWSSIELE